MTTIAFIIPTWKRPKQLEVAVESIASQITEGDGVEIRIVQDGEESGTVDAIARIRERWPAVKVYPNEHSDYSAAFREMFRAAEGADWAWTFGDDDKLRPNALQFILREMANWGDLSFVHVAETTRCANTKRAYRANTLLDLCCNFGWIEMTGFITGNITRGALLAKAAETPHWRTYAKSAFVQSCAILETLQDEPAAFMDVPLIETQSKEQMQDTIDAWQAQNIGARYMFVVDAIDLMFDQGILTKKLPPKFFRYLNSTLWDRFITLFANDFVSNGTLWTDDAWRCVTRFSQFLDDEETASALLRDAEAVRGMTTLISYLNRNVEGLRSELNSVAERRAASSFPYTFIEPFTAAETAPSASQS